MPFQSARNPLRKLPSVLAIPALRRRLERAGTVQPQLEDELVAMLELDPLAAVRALRAAQPPACRESDEMLSVRQLVRRLGPQHAARIFACDSVHVADEAGLMELWMHAVATAHAAREFAARTGDIDPEVAYLAGLLHDLPSWIRRLDAHESRSLPTDWVLHWQLPSSFVSMVLDLEVEARVDTGTEAPSLAAHIRAAELIAEFAGYRHPGQTEQAFTGMARELLPSQMQVAVRLRAQVEAAIAKFGLGQVAAATRQDARPLARWSAHQGTCDLQSMVLHVLGCAQPQTYREIVAMLTGTAVEGGHFDRAFFAKWDAASTRMTLRTKRDATMQRIVTTQLHTSRPESELLRRALQTQTPVVLAAEPNGDSAMLRALSADEVLAIPLNQDFDQPAFLLLDRTLTLAPLGVDSEIRAAQALGMSGSLLIQNLWLRRRRQRAQKFALTDSLTHLFNRRMGIHALEQAVGRTERDRSPLTVLMCDLDHFKQLNDTYGHLQGDAALRATATVLRSMVRASDTVCRYGGEEFLVVLPDTTPDEATVLATRMFTAVQERGDELELPLTISIGLTCYRYGDTVESIMHRSDRALYASKGYGRNRFSADVEDEDGEPAEEAPKPQRRQV
ncbi:MAG: diguanylate cyclase [Planctomycetota bacterium]|nr:diguanylate cyclase [Planctomycetota bacterium]